jgi:hypothetical protein
MDSFHNNHAFGHHDLLFNNDREHSSYITHRIPSTALI